MSGVSSPNAVASRFPASVEMMALRNVEAMSAPAANDEAPAAHEATRFSGVAVNSTASAAIANPPRTAASDEIWP